MRLILFVSFSASCLDYFKTRACEIIWYLMILVSFRFSFYIVNHKFEFFCSQLLIRVSLRSFHKFQASFDFSISNILNLHMLFDFDHVLFLKKKRKFYNSHLPFLWFFVRIILEHSLQVAFRIDLSHRFLLKYIECKPFCLTVWFLSVESPLSVLCGYDLCQCHTDFPSLSCQCASVPVNICPVLTLRVFHFSLFSLRLIQPSNTLGAFYYNIYSKALKSAIRLLHILNNVI